MASEETRAKQSEARRKWWASRTPEELEAYSAKQRGQMCPQRGYARKGDQRTDAQKVNDASRRTGRMVPCAICGTEVYRTPSQLRNSKNTYCSRPCRARGPKQQPRKPRKTYICPVCGEEFERLPSREKCGETMYCSTPCAAKARSGEGHHAWTGGRQKRPDGYVDINQSLVPDELRCMCRKDGRILEHRLVMAQRLGRPLKATEIVHHKNHIRDDNRLENLDLLPISHDGITNAERKIAELERQIAALKEQLSG